MPRLFLCLVFTMVAQAEGLVVTAGLRVNPSPAPLARRPIVMAEAGAKKEGDEKEERLWYRTCYMYRTTMVELYPLDQCCP